LSDTSEKGYLYLRKERLYRNKDGSVSRKEDGAPRVRRAGPALYDFIGVAPLAVNPRKGNVPAGRIAAALAGKQRSLAASAAARNAMRSSSRARAASSDDAIAMRNDWVREKQQALINARTDLRMPPHVGSVSKAKGVKRGPRGPMSAESKARAAATRAANKAAGKVRKGSKKAKKAAASPASSPKKKKVLSPEHLAAMKEGRKRAAAAKAAKKAASRDE
jgi:hypothetical protein